MWFLWRNVSFVLSTQRASQYEKETSWHLTSCRGRLAPMRDFRRQVARNRLTHGKRRTEFHNKVLEFQHSVPRARIWLKDLSAKACNIHSKIAFDLCHIQETRKNRFIWFSTPEKEHSVREQDIEDNVWTQGEEKEEWRKLHNERLNYCYYSCSSIIRAIKSGGMWQQGHVARIEQMRNAYRILSGNFNAKG
jgi:hypothetical protein